MSAIMTKTIDDSMDQPFFHLSAEALVRWADEEFRKGLVMSTSFGIQSAVTLHLATRVRPSMPVIWVDTGYLPDETHRYAETLTNLLDLNLKVTKSPISPKEMEARFGRLWESDRVEDLDLYDRIRKVEPMERALEEQRVTGWISGLRADQTEYRRNLPRVKRSGPRYRIYPILRWTSRDIYQYMQHHDLPTHPLFEQGYATVGDAHSSRAMTDRDVSARSTRFNGLKQECGLHVA